MEWQTIKALLRPIPSEQSDLGLQCFLRPICYNTTNFNGIQILKVQSLVHILHSNNNVYFPINPIALRTAKTL